MINPAPLPNRYGTTIFCDDVREEIGGKSSYIGAYKGSMLLNADFPLIYPKLGFGIILRQAVGFISTSIKFHIYLPGDQADKPSIVFDIPFELPGSPPPAPYSDSPVYVNRYQNIILSPVRFQEEGYVKVRAICDDEEVRLGVLKIERAPAKPS